MPYTVDVKSQCVWTSVYCKVEEENPLVILSTFRVRKFKDEDLDKEPSLTEQEGTEGRQICSHEMQGPYSSPLYSLSPACRCCPFVLDTLYALKY